VELAALAARLGCRLEGDGAIDITRVAPLDQAGPGDITFLANPRYAQAAQSTRASAVILGEDAAPVPAAMLRTPHPYKAFAEALVALGRDERPPAGVHPTAVVGPDVDLGEAVSIGPLAVIGAGVRIGPRTVLHPHVVIGPGAEIGADCVLHTRVSIRERTRIGDRVVIQDGAVIGSDGYGFVTDGDGVHHRIPQQNIVVIEDDVEVGANTTIDRPAVGETRIGTGTKIDNLVQIAHGVKVGRHVLLVAQVGIAGSAQVGDRVVLAGQVGVAGHVTLGDGVRRRRASRTPSRPARSSRAIPPSTTASGSRRRRCSATCQNSAGR
jgi:UDP-3-O-[3-hydroxymyristoyl] glucosamine N-acyltransferase